MSNSEDDIMVAWFSKPDYPIIYDTSFVIFWGIWIFVAILFGGLLMFAFVLMMMLVLISHEHAHIVECNRVGVGVESVRFTWLCGMVTFKDSDTWYAGDIASLLMAGVKDTGMYAVSFIAILGILNFLGRNTIIGFNFANNPFINFTSNMIIFSGSLFIGNFLPITYHTEKNEPISPDGWAALRFIELRDELWNEGAHLAMGVSA